MSMGWHAWAAVGALRLPGTTGAEPGEPNVAAGKDQSRCTCAHAAPTRGTRSRPRPLDDNADRQAAHRAIGVSAIGLGVTGLVRGGNEMHLGSRSARPPGTRGGRRSGAGVPLGAVDAPRVAFARCMTIAVQASGNCADGCTRRLLLGAPCGCGTAGGQRWAWPRLRELRRSARTAR